jgi:fatty acid desaturase
MSLPPRRRFACLARVLGPVDAERIWNLDDVTAPHPGEILLERRIDGCLERQRRFVLAAIALVFTAGLVLVWGVGPRAGRLWTAPLFALVVHGLFILVVHEASHKNLTRTPADRWIGAIGAGTLLLPFTAETFAAVHLRHHRRTNRPGDTNWTVRRQRLFGRSRVLYAAYEMVPLLNAFDRIRVAALPERRRPLAVALAWATSFATIAVFRPPLLYWLGVVVGLNVVTAIRHWTEHFDVTSGREAHTYRFALGFGIGNHAVHHRAPGIGAPALLIGLWFRRKDGSPIAAPFRILFDRRYRHLRTLRRQAR